MKPDLRKFLRSRSLMVELSQSPLLFFAAPPPLEDPVFFAPCAFAVTAVFPILATQMGMFLVK